MTGLMRRAILPLLVLCLAACGEPLAERGTFSEPEVDESPYGLRANFVPAVWDRRSAPMEEMQSGETSSAPKRIARSYSFYLSMPAGQVPAIQKRHLEECQRLKCTIIETTLAREIGDRFEGRASIRIAPEAFDAFVKIISSPPVEVIRRSEETEDKAVPMLQLEKLLESKAALRERFKTMLTAPGTRTVADLVAIEKELAQVQNDIETAQAEYDYLRTVTETVKVFVSYSGPVAQVGGMDFSPISYALGSINDTLASSVAGLIVFVAAALPWIPLVALLIWLIRVLWRRWRTPRKAV